MLHFMLNRPIVRESDGHAALNRFASLGAAIHRVGNSKEFQLLVPVRRPHRRNALLKQLTRQSFGDEFVLIDVTSFIDGVQFELVSEAEADEIVKRERLAKDASNAPVGDEPEFVFPVAYVDKS